MSQGDLHGFSYVLISWSQPYKSRKLKRKLSSRTLSARNLSPFRKNPLHKSRYLQNGDKFKPRYSALSPIRLFSSLS